MIVGGGPNQLAGARWYRIVVVVIATVLTIIAIPMAIVFVGRLVGLNRCFSDLRPSWFCTSEGRGLYSLLMILIGIPAAILWGRFLNRFARIGLYRRPGLERSDELEGNRTRQGVTCQKLPFGQVLVSGAVHVIDNNSRLFLVGSERCLFLAFNPLRTRSVSDGDHVRLVCQRIPWHLNVVLAYAHADRPNAEVPGIWLHGMSLVLLVASSVWFGWGSDHPSISLMVMSGALAFVNLLYLGLVLQARSRLSKRCVC